METAVSQDERLVVHCFSGILARLLSSERQIAGKPISQTLHKIRWYTQYTPPNRVLEYLASKACLIIDISPP